LSSIILNLHNEETLNEFIERTMQNNRFFNKESATDEEYDFYRVDKSTHTVNGGFDVFKIELKINYRNYEEYLKKNKIIMEQLSQTFVATAEWLDEYCRIYLNLQVKR